MWNLVFIEQPAQEKHIKKKKKGYQEGISKDETQVNKYVWEVLLIGINHNFL